jgi:hypothetical protein
MHRAEERLTEAHRVHHLSAQAEAWSMAERMCRYCDAVEAAYPDNAETAEWLSWARTYIQRLDPLTDPPAMPDAPEATPQALQPHLPQGWSAYSAEEQRPRPGPPASS